MPDLTPLPLPATDPTELFRRRDSLYAADLLITAIGHLDLFNRLAAQPATQAELEAALGLVPRPAEVMLTLFVAMGLLRREGQAEARYRLTELAGEHLARRSPWNLGPYFESLKERPICRDILGVLRSGQPLGWGNNGAEEEWAKAMEREEFAASFSAAMDSRGAYLAPLMAQALDCAGHQRLLDIAGASGIYAGAAVTAHPHLRAAVLEKPPVDRVARLALARRKLADRVEVIPGDMFQALPAGFDIHLYSHVLHDWDEAAVQGLLHRSFQALPPGGQIAIHDAHLQADKSGPLAVAEYAVLLMLSTPGKCYSVGELQQMLTTAGFGPLEERPTAANRSLVVARKR